MLENVTSVDLAIVYPTIGEWDFPRRPWQVAMLLLLGIAGAGPIVQSIGHCLEPESRMSLRGTSSGRASWTGRATSALTTAWSTG